MIDDMATKKDKMTIEDLAGMIERNLPTKEDVKKLRFEIEGQISGLRSELKDEIWGFRTELKNEIQESKVELEEVHDIVKRIDGKDLPNLKRRVTTIESIIKPLRK